jgi:hypothetical protein
MDRAKATSPLSIRTKHCTTNEGRAGAGCLRPNFAPCLADIWFLAEAVVKDLYQTLGVETSASSDAIQKAYRRLAQKLHPDLNPGNKDSEERFKDISVAYGLLSDGVGGLRPTSRWSDVTRFAVFPRCEVTRLMWWTVPAPSNEVP